MGNEASILYSTLTNVNQDALHVVNGDLVVSTVNISRSLRLTDGSTAELEATAVGAFLAAHAINWGGLSVNGTSKKAVSLTTSRSSQDFYLDLATESASWDADTNQNAQIIANTLMSMVNSPAESVDYTVAARTQSTAFNVDLHGYVEIRKGYSYLVVQSIAVA